MTTQLIDEINSISKRIEDLRAQRMVKYREAFAEVFSNIWEYPGIPGVLMSISPEADYKKVVIDKDNNREDFALGITVTVRISKEILTNDIYSREDIVKEDVNIITNFLKRSIRCRIKEKGEEEMPSWEEVYKDCDIYTDSNDKEYYVVSKKYDIPISNIKEYISCYEKDLVRVI